MNTKVVILTAVFNRKNVTLDFLKRLQSQKFKNFQIVVVDDGSTDGTGDAIRQQYPDVEVIRTKGDQWWAGSLDFGLKYISKSYTVRETDLLLIINDDTEFSDDYIENAVNYFKEHTNVQLFSQCYSTEDDALIDNGVIWDWNDSTIRTNLSVDEKIDCCSTRGLFLEFKSVEKIGDFVPSKLPHYLSDYEWTLRGVNKGLPIVVSEDVFVKTSSVPSADPEKFYYSWSKYFKKLFTTRNSGNPMHMFWFIMLCFPGRSAKLKGLKSLLFSQIYDLNKLFENTFGLREILKIYRYGKSALRSGYHFIREVFRQRQLIKDLSIREFTSGYRGSVLGMTWAFVEPVIYIAIMWFFFTKAMRYQPAAGYPYLVWLMCGMVLWTFVSNGISGSCNVFKSYSYLLKRTDFNISVVSVAHVLSMFYLHIIFLVLLLILVLLEGIPLNLWSLQVFYYWFAISMFLLGVTWLTATVSVFVKDISNIVSVVVQIGFWVSPIFWDINSYPQNLRFLLKLNPLYHVIVGYRNSLLSSTGFWVDKFSFFYFWGTTLFLMALGFYAFKKLRPHFADVLD